MTWNGVQDLSALAGRPVQFRFHLRDGHLYAFWVSDSRSGASRGYLAAGGPDSLDPWMSERQWTRVASHQIAACHKVSGNAPVAGRSRRSD